jgi:glycosyltransferase involved in cell wall biosynthesis
VLTHEHNQGVGGAMISGYRAALADGCDILIKIDGDGQMNTDFLPLFITPLIENRADYVKGNRFFSWRHLKGMPVTRLFGNGALSFISKISTGYWHVMDPTNGYTAIRAEMLRKLNLDGIDRGFFFETDMLFNLAEKKARVLDVPLTSLYHNTQSNLRIEKIIVPFLFKHTQRFLRRMRLA